MKCAASRKRISKNVILQETVEVFPSKGEVKWGEILGWCKLWRHRWYENMEDRGKKLIRVCANTKGAFTRLENCVENNLIDPKPEQLEVRLN